MFRGEWITPGQPAYEVARPWFNRRAEARPAVIARCVGLADAVTAVDYARERGLPIDVRSGGFAVGAPCADGGVLVDLG